MYVFYKKLIFFIYKSAKKAIFTPLLKLNNLHNQYK